jgi:hypothetical protein
MFDMRMASAVTKEAADTTADRKHRIPAKPRRMVTLDLQCRSVLLKLDFGRLLISPPHHWSMRDKAAPSRNW